MLLLATYRPGYEHAWNRKSYYSQVAVRPLSESLAEALLRELLGGGADMDGLRRHLVERTEGNPFFIEESVRHLVDTGVLAGARGRYRLTRPATGFEVPATIQALLAARIDRLSPLDKAVVQCASVIGQDIPVALLDAVAGVGSDELRRSLAHLQAAEFLYEKSLFPVQQYTFKHALTLDVAYSTLLHGRRRALHAHIVHALETLFADRLVEQADRVAHHAFRGEVWEKAVIYLRQAGLRAAARSFNREAVARFQEALVALGHLAETRDTIEQAIDIRVEMRHALLLVGDYAQIFDCLRDAGVLAARLDDRARLGWVSSYLAHYWWYVGDPDLAIEVGQRALDIAETAHDPVLRVLTNFHLGQAHHSLGQYPRAIEFFSQTVTALASTILAERFGTLYAVRARSWLAWCHAELGHFTEGLARGEEGVHIAETVDQPFSLITAYVGLGVVHLRRGEIAAAIRVLERALALCQARDLPVLFPTVASRLGAAYALHGRIDEALPLLERAAAEAASMSRLSGHSLRLIHLGEACLNAGRIEDALAAARRGLELARQHKERAYEAWALRLLGESRSRLTPADWSSADAAFAESLALATALGMRPLIAHCHAGLSRSQRLLGKDVAGEEHARVAAAMFEDMGMRLWGLALIDASR
jgi:tetratricopeptide (TPR) repeat protein